MEICRKINSCVNGNKEAKNASWLIAGKIAQMVLSLIISIFTTRYLGSSNYGLINYGAAYAAFFMSLSTLGINSVIIRDFVEFPDDQGKTIGTTIILRLISSALSTVTIVCIVSIVDYGETETIVVVGLCSVTLIFCVFDTLNYWFQSRYQSRVVAIATLIAYLGTSIYKIILLATNRSVLWFAFATSVDYIVYAVIIYLAYKKYDGPKLSFSINKAKSLLKTSYHYILSGMMVAIYTQTDKLMLKQMLDQRSVGYYSLASSINTMWVFVLAAIIDSIYPTIMNLYKSDKNAFKRKNIQLYAIIIYISIFVAILFFVFGKQAIIILYGSEYIDATAPLRIATWYTIFSYLGVARNAWIVCENKQKYLKFMYFGAVMINVILNYFMIPIWGASGAAIASLITQIMTSIVLPAFIQDMRPNVKLMIDAFLLKGIR